MPTRLSDPRFRVTDDAGVPISGARVLFYEAGTLTPKATYADAGLTVPNSNPVVADAGGRLPDVFLAAGPYRIETQTASGVSLYVADPVDGDLSALIAAGASVTGLTGDLNANAHKVTHLAVAEAGDDAMRLDQAGWERAAPPITVSSPVTGIVFPLNSDFIVFELTCVGFAPSAAAEMYLQVSQDGGATFLAGANYQQGTTAGPFISLTGATAAVESGLARALLYPGTIGNRGIALVDTLFVNNGTGSRDRYSGGGQVLTASTRATHVLVSFVSATVAAGTYTLRGQRP